MKVLLVTNMFPTSDRPSDGIFVAREVAAVREFHGSEVDVDVLHVDTVGSRIRYLTGLGSVWRRTRSFRPDVVHVHHGLTQFPGLASFRPKVVTFHGSDLTLGWQRAISKALLLLTSALPVLVSPHLADRLPPGPRRRARVIGCGVDTNLFHPETRDASSTRAASDLRRVTIGFPSSPERPGKDYGLFSATIAALEASGIDAQELILSGIEPDRVPSALRSVDLLLMTSRHEGSPVITKEALCCGVRVVSVDVGDVSQQLCGFSGCRLVTERDPQRLAEAVMAAIAAPPPDAEEAARRFGIERQARDLVELYRSAIDGVSA